jgi:hypothetical protein
VSKHLLKSPKTKTDNMTRRSWASLQQGVSTVSVQKPSLSTKKSKDP